MMRYYFDGRRGLRVLCGVIFFTLTLQVSEQDLEAWRLFLEASSHLETGNNEK